MRERSMRVFSWHCERAYARQGLGLAECDLFLVQLLSVAGMITVAHYTGLGLVHVFLRNEGERINGTKLGCFCVVVAAAGGMGSQLLFYKSRPKQHRRRLALAASALYPIFICINVILNSSSGRSSPAAFWTRLCLVWSAPTASFIESSSAPLQIYCHASRGTFANGSSTASLKRAGPT